MPSTATLARVVGIIGLVVCVATAIWSFAIADVGTPPDYALDSELIFRLERLVVVVVLALALAALIAKFLTGTLPISLGKEGVTWPDDKEDVLKTLEAHQRALSELRDDVNELIDPDEADEAE